MEQEDAAGGVAPERELRYTWAQVQSDTALVARLQEIYPQKCFMPYKIRALLGDAFCPARGSQNSFQRRSSDDPPLDSSAIMNDHFRPLMIALQGAGKSQTVHIAAWFKGCRGALEQAYTDIADRYAKEKELVMAALTPEEPTRPAKRKAAVQQRPKAPPPEDAPPRPMKRARVSMRPKAPPPELA